jgi:uracil-DNA glycosylase
MSIDRLSDLRALLAFYVEAGVDAVLDEAPVNRFTAEAAQPASSQMPAEPSPQAPPRARRPLPTLSRQAGEGREGAPADVTPNPRSRSLSPSSAAGGGGTGEGAPPAPDAAIMAARRAAASATSLDALRDLLERFEGCALRLTAKRLVFADGNPQARAMFVGEAPGREEDIAGLPFVGRSGQLLDSMMAAIGLDRTTAYIANIIPWRPPGNRTPTPQESQICLPFIKRQIELADPDILVCLGGPSAAALLGLTEGIRRSRGRWRVYHTGTREIRAIATFHPAYLLRTPLEKRFAWRDFQAIRAALAE